MDVLKRAVGDTQDWSDPQEALKNIDRATAARRKLEEGDSESEAWLRSQLTLDGTEKADKPKPTNHP
jgi:hypothetical protein